MTIKINVTRKDVEFCRNTAEKYLAEAAALEAKAKTCKPKQRGAYRSHAKQKRDSAARMQANADAQMGWLAENNFDLWLELKEKTL
ncbi:MAG: hypothetical protein ACYSYU_10810 [Planctomycetota bacterium]|jgi:hypothetical protein